MAPNATDYVEYPAELYTRVRKLGIRPAPKTDVYEHKQNGAPILYGARISFLGKVFGTRDVYRTRKEAKCRVATRALDFLEGWEDGRMLGFDEGLGLAGSFPSDHVIISAKPEDYGREFLAKKNAGAIIEELIKQAMKLVSFFPIGNKFYVYKLAVNLAHAMLKELKHHHIDVTSIVTEKFIDMVEETLEEAEYEPTIDFPSEEESKGVILSGKPLRAIELFAEQAIYIATMDTSPIEVDCSTFDVARELVSEIYNNFEEELADEFCHQLRRGLNKCLRERKKSEEQAKQNEIRGSAVPESRSQLESKSQPEMAQNQTLIFPIRTRSIPWNNSTPNPESSSVHKRKADTDEDAVPEVRQKIRRQ